jgi:hypothetical protein
MLASIFIFEKFQIILFFFQITLQLYQLVQFTF